ncbi:hypothetical protein Patl1_18685 [Pistacia atlantica]|uniref:Uncharacterized protein n=1 Tax=Pistacia atlantica TaxID=434234 RepID=A0ACC1BX97_9ROSI|nr:hypothetical protein Patl1_18685 [Pistacia atlantica]
MFSVNQTSIPTPQDDFMEIDDPIEPGSRAPPLPLLSAARTLNPFSLLDPNIQVREIPIEVKDGSDQSGQAPTIEDVTESTHAHGSESHGTVIVDEVDEDAQVAMTAPATVRNDGSHERHSSPTAPAFENLPDYSNDIEEEMVRAAIEASKREVEDLSDSRTEHRRTPVEDADLAHAVSLSLKTAEQEKALRQIGENVEASKGGSSGPAEVELGKAPTSNGRTTTCFPNVLPTVESVT